METQFRDIATLSAKTSELSTDLIRLFENLIATLTVEETSYAATALSEYQTQIELSTLMSRFEEVLTTIRRMQELWLFGRLDTIADRPPVREIAKEELGVIMQLLARIEQDDFLPELPADVLSELAAREGVDVVAESGQDETQETTAGAAGGGPPPGRRSVRELDDARFERNVMAMQSLELGALSSAFLNPAGDGAGAAGAAGVDLSAMNDVIGMGGMDMMMMMMDGTGAAAAAGTVGEHSQATAHSHGFMPGLVPDIAGSIAGVNSQLSVPPVNANSQQLAQLSQQTQQAQAQAQAQQVQPGQVGSAFDPASTRAGADLDLDVGGVDLDMIGPIMSQQQPDQLSVPSAPAPAPASFQPTPQMQSQVASAGLGLGSQPHPLDQLALPIDLEELDGDGQIAGLAQPNLMSQLTAAAGSAATEPIVLDDDDDFPNEGPLAILGTAFSADGLQQPGRPAEPQLGRDLGGGSSEGQARPGTGSGQAEGESSGSRC